MSDQSTKTKETCPHCGSESFDIEVWGDGLCPAEKVDGKWVVADSPAAYVSWNYGDAAICYDCGGEVE